MHSFRPRASSTHSSLGLSLRTPKDLKAHAKVLATASPYTWEPAQCVPVLDSAPHSQGRSLGGTWLSAVRSGERGRGAPGGAGAAAGSAAAGADMTARAAQAALAGVLPCATLQQVCVQAAAEAEMLTQDLQVAAVKWISSSVVDQGCTCRAGLARHACMCCATGRL